MPSAEVSGESGGLGRFRVVLGWAGSAEGDFQAEFLEFAHVIVLATSLFEDLVAAGLYEDASARLT